MATSGCHGSSSAMKQWAAADNNNVFIVCVSTFNSETKTSSYSYSTFVVITIHLNISYLSDFSTFSVVLMAKVWLHYCHHLYCVQNRMKVSLKIVLK